MNEMIDRMVAAARRHMAETGADFNSVDEGLAGIARAMFTAAREPTLAMLDRAMGIVPRDDAAHVWDAMIDEALE